MHIIDPHRRLREAMRPHQFELEDFYASFKDLDPVPFMNVPLEGRAEPLLLDAGSLADRPVDDEMLARLNTFPAILAFTTDAAGEAWLAQVQARTDRVITHHRLPMGADGWQLARHQCLYFWRHHQERLRIRGQMVRFSQEMDELIKSTQQDMLRAKKIHEDVVPRRMEEIRGIGLYTKYAVGEGAGSEYFDVIRTPHHTHLVFLHTNSYLASSCLMGLLNKQKDTVVDPAVFMQEAAIEVRALNAHKKKPVRVQLLWIQQDNGSLTTRGWCFGPFELHLLGRSAPRLPALEGFQIDDMEAARFELRLERGDRMAVLSPGFVANWDAGQAAPRAGFLASHAHLAPPELLMELFFQLRQGNAGDFLAKDATALMMEVNRHAIKPV
jgi:hypothetical protein